MGYIPLIKLQITPEITLLIYSVLKLRVFLQLDFVTPIIEKNAIERQHPAKVHYLFLTPITMTRSGIGETQKVLTMTSSKNGYGMTYLTNKYSFLKKYIFWNIHRFVEPITYVFGGVGPELGCLPV